MVILACAVLVVFAGIYVLTPLFKEPKGNLDVELLAETELDRLLNRKNVVYRNLKDLELEYKMGRLADTDFRRLEAGYKAEAAGILEKLDQLGVDENLDEDIEKAVATRKARVFPASGPQAESRAKCPACGAEVISGKRFCPDCGRKL
jgi:hypothetical protein